MVKEMVVMLTLTLTATATATAMVNAMATGTKINQSGFKRHGGGDVFLFLIFPPPLLLPSQAVTKGRHASSATAASAQAVAAVGAALCSGLEQSAEAAARRMPSLTPACCVVLVHKLNVCFTWQILPLNDLIPMCVPRNLK